MVPFAKLENSTKKFNFIFSYIKLNFNNLIIIVFYKIIKMANYTKLPIDENVNKELDNFLKMKKIKVFRKAVLSDFIEDTCIQKLNIHPPTKCKTKKYRIQGEFGEKKFIKP